MNFDQAREYAFTMPWKVSECFVGPDCWCRIIVPVEPIPYNDEVEHFGKSLVSTEVEYYEVVRDGTLDKETAEYIVRLHNEHYERVKQSCMDVMRSTMNSLIDLAPVSREPETRRIIRKEID